MSAHPERASAAVAHRQASESRLTHGIGNPRRYVALVAVTGAVALVGCSAQPPAQPSDGRSSGAASAASATPAGPGPAAAPDPNAPEIVAAGDIPDNQVFVPFRPPGGAFSMSVPQGWVQSVSGAATVFTDKFNSVRMDAVQRPAAPDVPSARAQDVPPLQRSTAGFVLGDVQMVQRSAGPAVLTTYTATSATSTVTGKSVTEAVERYAFWRSGQEVVLTLSGAKGSDNVDPWRKITDSFRWQR